MCFKREEIKIGITGFVFLLCLRLLILNDSIFSRDSAICYDKLGFPMPIRTYYQLERFGRQEHGEHMVISIILFLSLSIDLGVLVDLKSSWRVGSQILP